MTFITLSYFYIKEERFKVMANTNSRVIKLLCMQLKTIRQRLKLKNTIRQKLVYNSKYCCSRVLCSLPIKRIQAQMPPLCVTQKQKKTKEKKVYIYSKDISAYLLYD